MKNLMVKEVRKVKGADGCKHNPAQKKKAFTLVEILIVVAVIGILFVALVPRIDFAGDKARETGVKTDFRSFELAAEQLMREKAGLADYADVADLCADDGINLYLDGALKFDTTGKSAKKDQWNQEYTVQIVKPASATNANSGAIIFLSNGKDAVLSSDSDNYALAVTFVDGQIESKTIGFSSNIDSSKIASITGDTAASMTLSSGVSTLVYAK